MPQSGPDDAEVEYYKILARIAEERAREIRRIAALERARLEERLLEQQPTIDAYVVELEQLRINIESLEKESEGLKSELAEAHAKIMALEEARNRLFSSRAHRMAAAYVGSLQGPSLPARVLRWMRSALRHLKHIGR